MKPTLPFAALLMSATTLLADNSRYVTITATNNAFPTVVQIMDGEIGELISSACNAGFNYLPSCSVQKNGLTMQAFPRSSGISTGSLTQGTTVAGPASFSLAPGQSANAAMLTVRITPLVYDVNKTLILPPSTNQVFITLESSTNLVNWSDTTNGVYGSPDIARFFRIRMSKL
jgi:hypothetical protein